MYTMKEVCALSGLSYEGLKFYCNVGLIPNVKRNSFNYRVFDDADIEWLKQVLCLRKCGLGIQDMKRYMELSVEGDETIPQRQTILLKQKDLLEGKMRELQQSLDCVNAKTRYYETVLKDDRKQEEI